VDVFDLTESGEAVSYILTLQFKLAIGGVDHKKCDWGLGCWFHDKDNGVGTKLSAGSKLSLSKSREGSKPGHNIRISQIKSNNSVCYS